MSKETKRQKQQKLSQYKKQLKTLIKYRIYEPQSDGLPSNRQINKVKSLYNQNQKYLNNKEYKFVKFPRYTEKKLRVKTKKLSFNTTKSGVFIPVKGQRKAEFEFNGEYQEYRIKLTGKTKYGKNIGRKITTYIPIVSIDAKQNEFDRMRREFKNLKLNKNDIVRIKVIEASNDGFSNKAFESIEKLISYLDDYKKSDSDKLQFFRFITIEKVTQVQHNMDVKAKYSKVKKQRVNKTGRNY